MTDQQFADPEAVLRRYEYDDGVVLVADVGTNTGSVDVVDGTAIIVAGQEQYEIDLPEGTPRAFMKNGVVTIEMDE